MAHFTAYSGGIGAVLLLAACSDAGGGGAAVSADAAPSPPPAIVDEIADGGVAVVDAAPPTADADADVEAAESTKDAAPAVDATWSGPCTTSVRADGVVRTCFDPATSQMQYREECSVDAHGCASWSKQVVSGVHLLQISASRDGAMVDYDEEDIDTSINDTDYEQGTVVASGACAFVSGAAIMATGKRFDPAVPSCEVWSESAPNACYYDVTGTECASVACAAANHEGTVACDRERDATPLSFADIGIVQEGLCGLPASCPASDL